MSDTQPRGVLDVLEELDASIAANEDPRSCAALVFGFAIGSALKSGWTLNELAKLRLSSWLGDERTTAVEKLARVRKFAIDLQRDWLVSMAESVSNQAFAKAILEILDEP